jgi:hypothetical protein
MSPDDPNVGENDQVDNIEAKSIVGEKELQKEQETALNLVSTSNDNSQSVSGVNQSENITSTGRVLPSITKSHPHYKRVNLPAYYPLKHLNMKDVLRPSTWTFAFVPRSK